METVTSGYGLIEAPVWDPQRGLLFSDVFGGGVYCVTPGGEVSTVIEHPARSSTTDVNPKLANCFSWTSMGRLGLLLPMCG
jgi:sugar lactone lactonase YvrE